MCCNPLFYVFLRWLLCQRNLHQADLKAAAACAPDELDLAVALRLGHDVTKRLAAVHGEFNLHSKKIGDAGAATLARDLRDNTSITAINLAYNAIGAAGAASLADLLSHNTSITEINLSGNNIHEAGVQRIIALYQVRCCIVGDWSVLLGLS